MTESGLTSHTATIKQYLLTYLPTPQSRVLLEKLTGSQLVKKFPAFYGTWRFITAFTSAHHLDPILSHIDPVHTHHPTSWWSILILASHLSVGAPIGPFPSIFPTKTLYTPLLSPICATCPHPSPSSQFDHPNNNWWGEQIIKLLIM